MLVRALWSGVSRGTEALVALGRVPPSQWSPMRAPFQAGRVPVPGEVRLRQRRRGRAGPGRPARVARSSASTRTRPATSCPRAAVTPLPAGAARRPRRARRQHGDRAQRGLGRRGGTRASASTSSAPASSARMIAWLCGAPPRCRGHAGRHRAGPGGPGGGAGRGLRPSRGALRGDADLVLHASGSPDGLRTALARRRPGGARGRGQLVRRDRGRPAAGRGVPQPAACPGQLAGGPGRRRPCGRAGRMRAGWPRRWNSCATLCSTDLITARRRSPTCRRLLPRLAAHPDGALCLRIVYPQP